MEILFDRDSTTETIVHYAKNIGADLIVIGHTSTRGFGRWLKGDAAKGVVDHAHPPCSVLVIKDSSSSGNAYVPMSCGQVVQNNIALHHGGSRSSCCSITAVYYHSLFQ